MTPPPLSFPLHPPTSISASGRRQLLHHLRLAVSSNNSTAAPADGSLNPLPSPLSVVVPAPSVDVLAPAAAGGGTALRFQPLVSLTAASISTLASLLAGRRLVLGESVGYPPVAGRRRRRPGLVVASGEKRVGWDGVEEGWLVHSWLHTHTPTHHPPQCRRTDAITNPADPLPFAACLLVHIEQAALYGEIVELQAS